MSYFEVSVAEVSIQVTVDMTRKTFGEVQKALGPLCTNLIDLGPDVKTNLPLGDLQKYHMVARVVTNDIEAAKQNAAEKQQQREPVSV